jgi:carbohydrate-binding DOMON domain-containing protein
MKVGILILVLLLGAAPLLMGAAEPGIYFQMKDPVGDEHGYGTYQYPSNIAFKPYQGLFDINEFKVWTDQKGQLYLDTTFGKITNPWMAPEGFIHQNLRIFIDSVPNQGMTGLYHQGAYVTFNPKYAWDVCLKIVGWGNSQLITAENGKLKYEPLRTEVMGDNRTIRATVKESDFGIPTPNWHYYVLVGSYDGFGEDFFRKVNQKPGEWVIGGGYDENIEPQVLDILAPERGPHSQAKQLHSFDPQTGKLAELYPVGKDVTGFSFLGWLGKCAAILLVGGIVFIFYQKPRRISWFWVKGKKQAG